MEVMLKSKTVRETLKAKGYDLNQVEMARAKIGEDLRRLLENLAGDKPLVWKIEKDEPEVTILRRNDAAYGEDWLEEKQPDDKEVVQSFLDQIPEEIFRQSMVQKKKVSFREEAEHLRLGQESGEWPTSGEDAEEEKLSGESEEWDEDSEKSGNDQDSLCMILAEEKVRQRDRELQTDPSSGLHNPEEKSLRNRSIKETVRGVFIQFKCRDKPGARGRQGGPEKDSLRQVKRRHPQSRRTEWSDDGIEGTRQSEIQTVGSDTSLDE